MAPHSDILVGWNPRKLKSELAITAVKQAMIALIALMALIALAQDFLFMLGLIGLMLGIP